MSNKLCTCGKGYVSIWDGKCLNCRTEEEQKVHEFALDTIFAENPESKEDAIKFYKEIRGITK